MATGEDAAAFRWSTDACPAAERFDAYLDVVCEQILHVEPGKRPPHPFNMEIEIAPLGPLKVATICGSGREVFRTNRSIKASMPAYLLAAGTSTSWRVISNNAALEMEPGDLMLLDSRQEHGYRALGECDTCAIIMPPSWLETWMPDARQIVGKVIARNSIWGRVLAPFVQNLRPTSIQSLSLPGRVIADEIGALLQLTYGNMVQSTQSDSFRYPLLRRRIMDCILQRCSEVSLVAADVATSIGISTRTLHRVLSSNHQSFSQELSRARVNVALRMLDSRGFRRLTIAEIGWRAGFVDPSHFARVFRAYMGISPRAARIGDEERLGSRHF